MTGSELLIEGTTLTFPKSWFVEGGFSHREAELCAAESVCDAKHDSRFKNARKLGPVSRSPMALMHVRIRNRLLLLKKRIEIEKRCSSRRN